MKKTVTVVVGGQFGSEAKGKVISFLADEFDMAVRTGAPNAGHTVYFNDKMYKLQQIPATFPNPRCKLYIGAGALIDPVILAREVQETQTSGRIFIDPKAGILEPHHSAAESSLMRNIGSTGKGCGMALIDRINRSTFKLAGDALPGYAFIDTSAEMNAAIDGGKTLLVEGTQGFGLSIYHGNYPFVTSRDTTAANFLAEAGLSPLTVKDIILVIRTCPIRVAGNSGPLPNETTWESLSQKTGRELMERTTVTNKVRRVAEFDPAIVMKAIAVNRPTQIALQFLNYIFPADENKNGWDDLSAEAQKYIAGMEKKLDVPVTLIGTGVANGSMIDRR